jgi:TRAP-type C4-dicarboxylate transport system permease small subunit
VRPLGTAIAGALAVLRAITRILLVVFMLAVLMLTASQAIDRYALHTSFDAYEQLASVGVVWVTYFGYALGYHERANLRIELLDTLLTPIGAAIKRLVFDGCILALAIAINLNGWRVLDVASNQDIIGTPFTNAIVYWSLQSGTILIGVFAIGHLLQGALSLRLGKPPETTPHA